MVCFPHYIPCFLLITVIIPLGQNLSSFVHLESRAIIRYIATKYNDVGTSLYGHTLQEKATVEQWLEVEAQNYNPLLSVLVMELIINPRCGTPTNEIIVAEKLAKLEKVLDVYEAHFAHTGNQFLAGNFFSLTDLSHLPFTHYLVNVANRGNVITSRKHVNSWWKNISSRPSWDKVLSLHNK